MKLFNFFRVLFSIKPTVERIEQHELQMNIIGTTQDSAQETMLDEPTKADSAARTKILLAAGDLFMEFGPSRVKMEEIAEKLAMSKKTLYKHFTSKDEVLHCVIDASQCEIHNFMQAFMDGLPSAKDDDDFLMRVSMTIERLSERVATMWRSPFMKDIERAYPQLWQEFVESRRHNILVSVTTICTEAKRRGILRDDVNYDLFTLMYLHCVENIMHPRMGNELSMTAKQIFETLMTVLFAGVLTPKGRELGGRFKALQHLGDRV